jgi:hypothetical protein
MHAQQYPQSWDENSSDRKGTTKEKPKAYVKYDDAQGGADLSYQYTVMYECHKEKKWSSINRRYSSTCSILQYPICM